MAKINSIDLGVLSTDRAALEKFILTDDGTLLFGTVLYHKELTLNYYKTGNVKVTAAGTIPETNLFDLDRWGWKSSGYGVVTEPELRPKIAELIIEIKNKEL